MSRIAMRGWRPSDADRVDTLLDPHPDPYWLLQRPRVHGVSARPDRFAITLVAEDDSGLVGAGTLYENPYHPGRYPTAVEVRPDRRRCGVGRQLLAALAENRPSPRPLAVRIRDANHAAMAFASAVGSDAYQHCPVPTVKPAEPHIRRWTSAQATPSRSQIRALGGVPADLAVQAMVTQYVWVHEPWAPIGDRAKILQLWTASVAEADPDLSSVALVQDQIVAVVLVWVAEQADAVGETTIRDQTAGAKLVAACVARSLSRLDNAGITEVTFDGHDDDPHLRPVIDSMGPVDRDPVSLLELRPTTAW